MILATAMISGFKYEIRNKIFGFWGHIHITDPSTNQSLIEAVPIEVDEQLVQEILMLPSPIKVTQVVPYVVKPGIINFGNEIEGIILKGAQFSSEFILSGDNLSLPKDEMSNDIIISRQTANRIKGQIGDDLIIHFIQEGRQLRRKFTISGIYKTGLEEYDKKFALVDIRQLQAILGWELNQVGGVEIYMENLDELEYAAAYLYSEVLPVGYYAETIRQKLPEIFDWLDLQDINELVILALMLLVAIINMITALLILILERTNTIGILKALGALDGSIRRIFIYYGIYIVSFGLFWGNLIGLTIAFTQKYFGYIRLDETNYYLDVAPIKIEIATLLLLNLGTLMITAIFLLIPTFMITRISPVTAIRFK
jgi:lipoprotein-releasing system permease protein